MLAASAFLAGGADVLGVHALDEARALRQAGIEAPILVLGPATARKRPRRRGCGCRDHGRLAGRRARRGRRRARRPSAAASTSRSRPASTARASRGDSPRRWSLLRARRRACGWSGCRATSPTSRTPPTTGSPRQQTHRFDALARRLADRRHDRAARAHVVQRGGRAVGAQPSRDRARRHRRLRCLAVAGDAGRGAPAGARRPRPAAGDDLEGA